MNAAATGLQSWSRRTWWGVGLGLFALQMLLLFWFGARGPVQPRPVSRSPQLEFAEPPAAEWLLLQDPTLFAHGHARGFSGSSWMRIPVPEYQPPEWSEPPRWLALDGQQLGNLLRRFVQTNPPIAPGLVAKPAPQLTAPDIAPSAPATALPSTLRVEGDWAARRLLTQPDLPPVASADLITNSLVRVLVDGRGNVVSMVLLGRSGSEMADARALALARTAQFEPLPRAGTVPPVPAALTAHLLVFEWQTVPLPPTNAPAVNL